MEDLSLNQVLFNIGTHQVTLGHIVFSVLTLIGLFLVYRFLIVLLLRRFFARHELDPSLRKSLLRGSRNVFILVGLIALVFTLGVDYVLYSNENVSLRINTLFEALLIFQIARLLDWAFAKFILQRYYRNRDQAADKFTPQPQKGKGKNPEATASRIIQYIVYVFAALLILSNFQLDFTLFTFSSTTGEGDIRIPFRISSIFRAILVLLLARLLVWVMIQLVLYGYYKRKEINIGAQYAINQLLSYVVYVIAILVALQNLGIQMTLIWGGAAALLVGVGLGLQQTFNDLISGVILLFERTVEVGDVVNIDGLIGRVKKIGLRTSVIETWENIAVVVPNSKLINENVINYSHNDLKTRFIVNVGVAYGSDTQLVRELLLQAAENGKYILEFPKSFVRFTDFGNSSLDFELHFWTRRLVTVEDVKSDLRFEIDRLFREHNVTIPFPQRDVWIRQS